MESWCDMFLTWNVKEKTIIFSTGSFKESFLLNICQLYNIYNIEIPKKLNEIIININTSLLSIYQNLSRLKNMISGQQEYRKKT